MYFLYLSAVIRDSRAPFHCRAYGFYFVVQIKCFFLKYHVQNVLICKFELFLRRYASFFALNPLFFMLKHEIICRVAPSSRRHGIRPVESDAVIP